MKKVIAILAVLMLVATAVFATATVKVRSKVGTPVVEPTFILKADLFKNGAYDYASAREGSNDGIIEAEVLNKSIRDENITVYFQISQYLAGGSQGQIVKLGVGATQMKQVNDDGTEKADGHVVPNFEIGTKTPNSSEDVDVQLNDAGQFVVTYLKQAASNTLLADFSVTWLKDANAVDGLYQASVTLTIDPE